MDSQLQSHIELIYDSITDEDGWDSVIQTLVRDLGFRSGHLSLEAMDQSGIKMRYSSGISDEENRLIVDHFHQIDPWTQALSQQPPGKFHLSEEVVLPRAFKRSEFYNDYCKNIDLGHATGCYIETDAKYGARMGFHHSHKQGSIGEKIIRLNQLVPHLKRAVTLRQKIADTGNHVSVISTILDRLRVAALMVDEKGRIRYFNAQAESLLSQTKTLKIATGRLMAKGVQDDLDRLINLSVHAAQGANLPSNSNTLIIRDADDRAQFEIQIEPFYGYDQRFGFQYAKPLALLLINDVVPKRQLNTHILEETFGLTKKETRLAEGLVSGRSLTEIAQTTHRSMNTLKTQLRSLFKKTDTTSQAQLNTRLLSSLASVRTEN